MPRWLVPVLVALTCLGGCAVAHDETARKLLDSIVANHVGELTWAIAWRSLLGGFLGLGLGVGTYFGVRRLNGFRWNWEYAKWARVVTGAAYAVVFAGALAWFGFWQGTLRGTEQVMRESQLATEVLPILGEAGSTLLAVVYIGAEEVCEQNRPLDDDQAAMLALRLDAYVADEWRMDVATLRARIADARGCVLATGVAEAKREIYARYPQLADTVGDDILLSLLDRLANYLVASLAENERVEGFSAPVVDMLARLDEAAARDGDAELSHRELSEHVVSTMVVPMIMMPVEHVAGGQKRAGLYAMLGLLLISIGFFQLAHHLTERRVRAPA